jgi:hypothetical protein
MKPRGRPPLDRHDVTVKSSIYLPAKTYEQVCREAHERAVTVPEYIRQALKKHGLKSTRP